MTDPNALTFSFAIKGYDGTVRVANFSGQETMSELFTFQLDLAVEDEALDFAQIVGADATLTLNSVDSERVITGIISRLSQRATDAWYTIYSAEFVPKVWLLTQRYDCRIFQDKTALDIVQDVFKSAGLGELIKPDVRGTLKQRTYCVQYRESDWDFISRLLEEEGIYYFFQQTDKGTIMKIANVPQSHEDILGETTVPYHTPSGLVPLPEWIYDIALAKRVRSGKVTLADYNFKTPRLDLRYEKTISGKGNEKLEVYDYPGLYEIDQEGLRQAGLRIQAILAQEMELSGASQCRRLAPGHKFKIDNAPHDNFNGEYVLTSVQHAGTQPLGENDQGSGLSYQNRFHAIPMAVPFRPQRVTPKPVVEGVQTAIVTGPAGEEVHTDEFGRVKVQFPWDRVGGKNDKSSCWVRVSQLWAGEGWGAMFIPRIGQEVIVDFIEGDPDRPIITGRVYNAVNMPPYGLDGEKTKSTIKSNSSKGGGGSNEYRFEDKKGSEEIYQHAQKDLTIVTENDKNQSTAHDETLKIGHDRTKKVGNNESTKIGVDRTEEVGNNEKIKIGNDRTESVGNNESIEIATNRTEKVGGNESISISGNRSERVGGNEAIEISGNRDGKIAGNDSWKVAGNESQQIGGAMDIKISGSLGMSVGSGSTMEVSGAMAQMISETFNCEAKDSVVIASDKDVAIKCGKAEIVLKKDGTIFIKGKDIKIDGSGKIDMKSVKDMILKGKKILQN